MLALEAGWRSVPSFFIVVAVAEFFIGPRPVLAQANCTASSATVIDAYRSSTEDGSKPAGQQIEKSRDVELKQIVAVEVKDLKSLIDEATCRKKPIVLFIDGYPLPGVTPYPPINPSGGILKFVLRQTQASQNGWTSILGRPDLTPRKVTVSVGLQDQYPIDAATILPTLDLKVVPQGWLLLWAAIFVLMVGGFFWCVRRTSIIRDGNPDPGADAGSTGTYSLAKSQGALWFFIILASYLLIGIVTGDFSNSINSTALILLGIGAGTVLGSAAIDASKSSPDALKVEQAEAAKAKGTVDALLAVAKPNADQLRQLRDARSLYRKLTHQSEHFITDILSDANGINFHRFQIAAWTLVLSIIFIRDVYENLAMPIFDTTLMGLLGLSAATYLGLKIPEPTVPPI
jgi:hypothetical protein